MEKGDASTSANRKSAPTNTKLAITKVADHYPIFISHPEH